MHIQMIGVGVIGPHRNEVCPCDPHLIKGALQRPDHSVSYYSVTQCLPVWFKESPVL